MIGVAPLQAHWSCAIGQELGIDEVGADLLPEQKLDRNSMLISAGKKVAMIGDRINDAPALMQADVGFARWSGTDLELAFIPNSARLPPGDSNRDTVVVQK